MFFVSKYRLSYVFYQNIDLPLYFISKYKLTLDFCIKYQFSYNFYYQNIGFPFFSRKFPVGFLFFLQYSVFFLIVVSTYRLACNFSYQNTHFLFFPLWKFRVSHITSSYIFMIKIPSFSMKILSWFSSYYNNVTSFFSTSYQMIDFCLYWSFVLYW